MSLIMLPHNIGIAPVFDTDIYEPDTTVFNKDELRWMSENNVSLQPAKIWIPDEAKERCDQGIVKYVGSAVTKVQIGDYVLFSGYTGSMVRLEDELTIIFHEDFVIAKFADEPTVVPHLYFRARDGEYIPANSHQAFELIRNAYTPLKVKAEKPRLEDYNAPRN